MDSPSVNPMIYLPSRNKSKGPGMRRSIPPPRLRAKPVDDLSAIRSDVPVPGALTTSEEYLRIPIPPMRKGERVFGWMTGDSLKFPEKWRTLADSP